MKVHVSFTVEFSEDQYNEAWGQKLTKQQIRHNVKNMAMNKVVFSLSDTGVDVEVIGNA